MKKISTMLLALSLISLTHSCSDDENISTFKNNYTGKELFKGILFARGVVAENLSSIKNSYSYYASNKIENEEKINEILNYIEINNPNYFESFKNKLSTKNPLLIRESLENASKIMYESSIDLLLQSEDINIKKMFSELDLKSDIINGQIDYNSLYRKISSSRAMDNINPESEACAVAGVVLAVAAYVVVVHAAAAMTYVGVAWVAEYYAAVHQEQAFSGGGREVGFEDDDNDDDRRRYSLDEELLIYQISIL